MYTSDKPRQPMDQTFNINNWGFGSADRKTLKSKIDSPLSRNRPQQVIHLHLIYFKIISLILKEWLISRGLM